MAYDLTDLRVFLASAETGNLTRGAEQCHLSTSSASLRIKNLESTLGVSLFTRRARGVVVTAAGQVLLEHARRCLAQLEQLHCDLIPFTHGMTNNVTLFANNNAVATHLPNDLAIFFRKHPDVRITLEERMTHEILAAVADGRADLGVVAHQESHPELSFIPYRQDKLVLITPQGHPLLQMDEVSFSQCLAYPFICLQPGAAVHTFLMSHATALGERMDIRVQVSGYDAVVKLVASGAGIGIVPNSAIGDRESVGLGVIDISDTWAIRDLRVCVSRQAAPNPARDRLIEILCTA